MNSKKLALFICIVLTLPAFAQQPDMSLIPYRQGDLWGYANPDKSIAIKPAYAEAKWFVAGYAVVKKGSKYGYIDRSGRVVIPFKFYTAKSFRYGYFDGTEKNNVGGKMVQNKDSVLFAGASLKPDGVESCINTKGSIMAKCPAINENSVADNIQTVSVTTEKVYTLVNSANLNMYDKLVDDYTMTGDDHTYYIGIKNNLYGVINNTFDIIIPFEYVSIKKININGAYYLQGQKSNMYGMFKGNGSIFIPVEKTKLIYVRSNTGNVFFIETKDGKTAVRDFTYHDVINANYSDIIYDEEGGFVLTGNDNKKGFYFLDNKIIEPRYTDVKLMKGGRFVQVTTPSGKIGYVNNQGTEFFDE